MNGKPWLSVIVSLGKPKYLSEALASLKEQPDSTGIQVFVVDDGSHPMARPIVQAHLPRACLLSRARHSPAAVLKAGLEQARAPFIGFLNADDRAVPGGLDRLRRALDAAPGVVAAQGTVRRFQRDQHRGPSFLGYNLGALMVRRAALEKLGGLNPMLWKGEDVDLFARVRQSGWPVLTIADPVLHYRNAVSLADPDVLRCRIGLIRAHRQNRSQPLAETGIAKGPITVALVVKDGMPKLVEAVKSLRGQTSPPDRIIAVVGASEDGTTEWLAEQADIEVVPQTGAGLAQARNQAVGHVDRGWLAFLDHDDLWAPEKLARQRRLAGLVSGPSACLCHFVTESGDGQAESPRVGWTPSALFAHVDVFRHIGPFDASLGLACDTDWFRRLRLSRLPCLLTASALMTKTRHGSNLSADPSRNRAALFAMLARHRKHASAG